MARSVSGYIGNTPNFDGPTGFVPGVWTLDGAYDRIRAGQWVTSLFPSAYQSLINGFATQRYVSPSGNNSNSGTTGSPWLTLEHAIANTPSGGAIVILPGTYAITSENHSSYSEGMLRDNNKALHFIGVPGKVIITEADNLSRRDNHMWCMLNTGTRAYGLIVRRDNNGRVDNYATAVLGRDAGSVHGRAYNCVFQEMNANGWASLVYDNTGVTSVII
jgi:hypothetical protein